MSNIDHLVSLRDAAPIVGTAESTLRKMVRAGVIPHLRTGVRGGGIRIIPAEIIKVLRERTTTNTEKPV